MEYLNPIHYLPSEELKFSNYPEVYEVMGEIDELQRMLEPIMTAVYEYDEGMVDAMYVNIAEVEKTLQLSYEITDFLGEAPKPCFDILLPMRETQEALHELVFSFKYEKAPVVIDKQRTAMRRLNDVVNKEGEVVEYADSPSDY